MAIKKKTTKEPTTVTVQCIVHNCGTGNGKILKGETAVVSEEIADMLVERKMVKVVK